MIDARIISENQRQEALNNSFYKLFKRVPWVYAHGKLETELGTDIIYLLEGDMRLRNGLIAYTHPDKKPVKFFLYKNPRTFELTGIVCYTEDREACEYGKKLVEERPMIF